MGPPGVPRRDEYRLARTKFRDAASEYMNDQEMQTVIDTVWNLEELDDMSTLPELMVLEE